MDQGKGRHVRRSLWLTDGWKGSVAGTCMVREPAEEVGEVAESRSDRTLCVMADNLNLILNMLGVIVLYCAMLSWFSRIWLFVTTWTVAHQDTLSMSFSRQVYCSGLPCPPPGYLPNPGIKPLSFTSPALAGMSFTTNATRETLGVFGGL